MGTNLKPFVDTYTLTLTFAVGTIQKQKARNRDQNKAKTFDSYNPTHKTDQNTVPIQVLQVLQVQHSQNATWEPATVISQCAPNSYWIVQENGAKQPKVYRHTRHMLKIRSTPMDGKQNAQARHCAVENNNAKFQICLLYTSPSPRDATLSRMPSSA